MFASLETEKDAKDLKKCSKSSSSIKRKTLPNYSKNHLKKVAKSSVDTRQKNPKNLILERNHQEREQRIF